MSESKKRYKDPDVLRALYWEEDMSFREIADRYGVHQKTVWRWFEKYNIDRHAPTGGRVEGQKSNKLAYGDDPSGYCKWSGTIDIDGFSTTFVHQLLAVADGADPYKVYSGGEYHIHHKNGVKWDNRPENIEVVTPKEHAEKHPERYEHARERDYTDEEMIEWLNSFVAEFGYVPTSGDIEGWPGPSRATYSQRFGSWKSAVNAAGWKLPNHPTDVKGRRIGHEDPKPIDGGEDDN